VDTDTGKEIPQIVFYQSGLGTGQQTKLNALLAGGIGWVTLFFFSFVIYDFHGLHNLAIFFLLTICECT